MLRVLRADELLDAASIAHARPVNDFAAWLIARTHGDAVDAAHLPIGMRDTILADVRSATFGDRLELSAACPGCGAALDVLLSTDDLPQATQAPDVATIEIAGCRCQVRALTSHDLSAIAHAFDLAEAREILAWQSVVPLDDAMPEALDEHDVAQIAETLALLDPAADPYVTLSCDECGTTWDAPIDMAALLASDIATAAATLIDEVDDLARAYHWSEDAILALSPTRRRAYLARVRR